ncbi:MAG: endonuclease [Ignavibacteria bacterium]|nr:endonuclease [Ignavibacteria bacterium]
MKKIKTAKPTNEKKRMAVVIKTLESVYPTARIGLEYRNPFQLMISTILSAQCTDARVNMVTEKIFKKYSTPEDFISIPVEILEQEIFSTGYYKAKSKNIQANCRMLIDEFNGIVPNTMEELLRLPGVGRKTANVILGHCFEAVGIVVDTHVSRIANRMGFAATQDAGKIEYALMELVPKKIWMLFTHYWISLGRQVCTSRKAKCGECSVAGLCQKIL